MNERRLFGEIAIEMGYLTREQLIQGLERQVELKKQGEGQLIGVVLVEMGIITPDQVFSVLEAYEREKAIEAGERVVPVSAPASSDGSEQTVRLFDETAPLEAGDMPEQ